jgi:ATP-dependent RNA helicase DDX52/ROK1
MGFVEQIDAVVKACTSPKLTKALFSATLPEVVENLANSVMSNPMRLTVGERGAASETVAQSLVFCGRENGKLLALRQLFAKGVKPPVIVFVQSKDRAKQLAKELQGDGLRLGLIHAAMSDGKRQAQVDRFRGGDTWVLIATDLMARGMDFFGVSTVVNFDLKQIANVMKNSGCDVPGWMLQSGSRDPKLRRRKRKDGREDNPRREAIDPRVSISHLPHSAD